MKIAARCVDGARGMPSTQVARRVLRSHGGARRSRGVRTDRWRRRRPGSGRHTGAGGHRTREMDVIGPRASPDPDHVISTAHGWVPRRRSCLWATPPAGTARSRFARVPRLRARCSARVTVGGARTRRAGIAVRDARGSTSQGGCARRVACAPCEEGARRAKCYVGEQRPSAPAESPGSDRGLALEMNVIGVVASSGALMTSISCACRTANRAPCVAGRRAARDSAAPQPGAATGHYTANLLSNVQRLDEAVEDIGRRLLYAGVHVPSAIECPTPGHGPCREHKSAARRLIDG